MDSEDLSRNRNDFPSHFPPRSSDDPFVTDLNQLAAQLHELIRSATQVFDTVQQLLKMINPR